MRHQSTAATLTLIFKKAIWLYHDHLGKLILINIFWWFSLILLIPMPIVTAGLFYLTAKIADYQTVTMKDFLTGIRLFWNRTIWLFLIWLGATGIIWINLRFYLGLTGAISVFGAFWAGLCFWLMLILLILPGYVLPILVIDNIGIMESIKKGLWLFLDNLKLNFLLILILIPLQIIFTVLGITLILVAISWFVLVQSVVVREILRRYRPELYPISSEDEEIRQWRHVLKPWEIE